MAVIPTSAHPMSATAPMLRSSRLLATPLTTRLQTHVEKRLSHHFQAGVSYTWSHALDEQSDIGLFFTGDNPNNLRDSYAVVRLRPHQRLQRQLPGDAAQCAARITRRSPTFTNDWNLTGLGVIQSGEPYSLYEFYGAVGSVYFGDYPTLMNPVLPIKNPQQPEERRLPATRAPSGQRQAVTSQRLIPAQIAINYLAPGQKGIPVSTRQRSPGHLRNGLCSREPAQHLPPGRSKAVGYFDP